jgi:two-component system, LytTR family, response regulator
MKIYRVLIVDDEALTRRAIRRLLAAESDMEVAGECEDGEQAVAAVHSLSIDILFLDVRMPRKDGFQVLESLAAGQLPLVVFVTAHQEFAVRAFEFNSIDYLLKPFDRTRFQRTLTRVRERLAARRPSEDNAVVPEIWRFLRAGAGSGLRIPVKQGRKVLLIRQETIDWVEAADNYLILHCGKQEHIIRKTISGLEGILEPGRFLRIHRSALVNLDRIQFYEPNAEGDYTVTLTTGLQLTLSRGYRDRFFSKLLKT